MKKDPMEKETKNERGRRGKELLFFEKKVIKETLLDERSVCMGRKARQSKVGK